MTSSHWLSDISGFIDNTANITGNTGSLWIGFAWTANYLDGDIAEIIILKTNVNRAQRIIIHNYLAAKYGLSLGGGNDVYDEDDAGYDHELLEDIVDDMIDKI